MSIKRSVINSVVTLILYIPITFYIIYPYITFDRELRLRVKDFPTTSFTMDSDLARCPKETLLGLKVTSV